VPNILNVVQNTLKFNLQLNYLFPDKIK